MTFSPTALARLEELRAKRDGYDAELGELGSRKQLNAGEQEHWNRTLRARDRVNGDIEQMESRSARVVELREKYERGELREYPGTPYTADRQLSSDVTSRALYGLDRTASYMSERGQDTADRLIRADSQYAREFEVHSRPEYESAFRKLLQAGEPATASLMMTDAERASLVDSFSARAQVEGTSASGGYAIPVFIDPSILLSNQESFNPFLQIGRTVDISTNAWKGVSSAGVSWSFDAEGAAVSDDSLTSITQPTVTVFMARGFIPYSIEVGQDWPDFQSEMARVLAIGYDELLLDKFTRGSGSGEPRGILTALAASSPTVIVTSMTDGAFGQEDVYATWAALPQKFRRRASWMMSVDVMNKIRQFGDASHWHAVTKQLPDGAIDLLFERPVFENPYFPVFSSTTGASNRLVVGDFSEYVVARRSGMTAELVPHLLDTSTGRPTGERGFFAWARIGGNSVLDGAFALQANT